MSRETAQRYAVRIYMLLSGGSFTPKPVLIKKYPNIAITIANAKEKTVGLDSLKTLITLNSIVSPPKVAQS